MELGSEFEIACFSQGDWQLPTSDVASCFCSTKENLFLLSGRTAIDYVLRDIHELRDIKNVYMPAYCCSSMIVPFIKNNIAVDFYDITLNNGTLEFCIDEKKEFDVLYLNNYFGYRIELNLDWIKKKKEKGVIVLYDRSHSLFLRDDPWIDFADYTFCSLRKWFAIATGAILSKSNGSFNKSTLRNCDFALAKIKAQKLKWRYLHDDKSVGKDQFISLFAEFNRKLETDYEEYSIDETSLQLLKAIDFDRVKVRRSRNVNMLYSELADLNSIKFVFERPDSYVVPLFVPILVKSKKCRDYLQSELISNQVYCPIHWTKSPLVPSNMHVDKIYDQEISLLCDQRYDPGQLVKMVEIIKNFKYN